MSKTITPKHRAGIALRSLIGFLVIAFIATSAALYYYNPDFKTMEKYVRELSWKDVEDFGNDTLKRFYDPDKNVETTDDEAPEQAAGQAVEKLPRVENVPTRPRTTAKPSDQKSDQQTVYPVRSFKPSAAERSPSPPPAAPKSTAPAGPPVVETVHLRGIVTGIPVARFDEETWTLQSDGALVKIERAQIVSEALVQRPFNDTTNALRAAALKLEFGDSFDVQAAEPYIFVHSKGVSQRWDERFAQLRTAMLQFCRTRGLNTQEMIFPLVVVIFKNEDEFYQYGRTHEIPLPPECRGIYSQTSNRILLYEESTKQETLDTIFHEAAHQLAYNIGLHQRCADTPLWLSEGVATLFEAPAYAQPNATNSTPWPPFRQATWRELLKDPSKVANSVNSLVESNKLFKSDPDTAYAIAWGMTHYLSNKHSRKFNEYLQQTSKLAPFVEIDSKERSKEFKQFFGSDIGRLSRELQSHIESL